MDVGEQAADAVGQSGGLLGQVVVAFTLVGKADLTSQAAEIFSLEASSVVR